MDDLPDYFHNLREDASALNNHMGRTYKVEELFKAGFVLNEMERQAGILQIVLVALPMGSIHAVDYSQGYHEGMLLDAGVVGYAELLHYGRPMELWSEGENKGFHGVYIDDNGIVGIVPKGVALQGLADADTCRAADCDRAYRSCDFPPEMEKGVRHRVNGGCIWGAQIEGGEHAWVGDKLVRRWINACLCVAVASARTSSKEIIDSLEGSPNASMLYRRPALCLLDHVYRDVRNWGQGKAYRYRGPLEGNSSSAQGPYLFPDKIYGRNLRPIFIIRPLACTQATSQNPLCPHI